MRQSLVGLRADRQRLQVHNTLTISTHYLNTPSPPTSQNTISKHSLNTLSTYTINPPSNPPYQLTQIETEATKRRMDACTRALAVYDQWFGLQERAREMHLEAQEHGLLAASRSTDLIAAEAKLNIKTAERAERALEQRQVETPHQYTLTYLNTPYQYILTYPININCDTPYRYI